MNPIVLQSLWPCCSLKQTASPNTFYRGDLKKLQELEHSWHPEIKSYCQMLSATVEMKGLAIF